MRTTLMLALALPPLAAACGGQQQVTPVRGDEVAGLDQTAFSTSLDARDLDQMFTEVMTTARQSAIVARWRAQPAPPVVAVLPLRNETTEHVDSQLATLGRRIETELINAAGARVVSLETQPTLMEEVRRQSSTAFDQSTVATWGRQLGVQFVVDGNLYSADERAGQQRRIQYFLFVRIIDVSTSEVVFQQEASVTKALLAR
ncbi:MAG: penicillin-binding protein activator LpoB [Sandaracinaceae bacterium]